MSSVEYSSFAASDNPTLFVRTFPGGKTIVGAKPALNEHDFKAIGPMNLDDRKPYVEHEEGMTVYNCRDRALGGITVQALSGYIEQVTGFEPDIIGPRL